MSAEERRSVQWLSVAPPISIPGVVDMSSQLRPKKLNPLKAKGGEIPQGRSPSLAPSEEEDAFPKAPPKQEEKAPGSAPKLPPMEAVTKIKIPPPANWHRPSNAASRPSLGGKSPPKQSSQEASECGGHRQMEAPSRTSLGKKSPPKKSPHDTSEGEQAANKDKEPIALSESQSQAEDADSKPTLHPTTVPGGPLLPGKSALKHISQDALKSVTHEDSNSRFECQYKEAGQHLSAMQINVDPKKKKVAFVEGEEIEAPRAPIGKHRPRNLVIGDYPSQPLPTLETYAPLPLFQPVWRRSLAKQNEASAHSSHLLVEEVKDFTLWESSTKSLKQLWRDFLDWNNRKDLKQIAASLDVLRTYHDSILTGTIPLSMQIKTWVQAVILSTAWHLTEFVLATLSCCLYIYETYKPFIRRNWCFRIQNCVSAAFLGDYVLRLYTEPVRLYYIFSFRGVIDLLSVVPIILFFRSVTSHYGAAVIRLLQFVRILRIFGLIRKLGLIGTTVNEQISLLAIATFGAIIFDSAILQWLEYYTAPQSRKAKCPVEGCLSFWQSFYFLVVTVSTVGYGDFSPKTRWGQALTSLTIVCALVILPIRINAIHSLASRRPYGGTFSTQKIVGSRFLILTGSITFPGVQSFLAEFFKPTHRQELQIYPSRVIILAPFTPSFDLKNLLYCYDGSAEFIEGSPIRQTDLARVSAHKAMAIFLLADRDAEDKKVEDSAQIVRALAVHRFCRVNSDKGHPRIIVEVLDPETQRSAVWDEVHEGHVEVICPAKMHYKMMARSCLVKGLYTFITNLFTSELRLRYMPRKHFLTEYFHSFDNEVYPVILPVAFQNLPFEEVADIIFVKFSSTLFAVDTEVLTKSTGRRARKVLLFPKGYLIRHDDVGMVIANDLSIAFAIASYEEEEEKIGPCQRLWESFTKTVSIRRTTTEGIQLLDPKTRRWRRSSLGLEKIGAWVMPSESFGVQSPHVFPNDTHDSEYTLESDLRSAIQRVYTTQDFPDWREQVTSGGHFEKTDNKNEFEVNENSKGDMGFRFPKGMSLEQAADTLLAWPPLSKDERPHPVVIEQRQDLIMKNLEERKVAMVAFNVPHILLCCQAGWPRNLFYFLGEHRKPRFPNPPIVILYPHDPTAQQWGPVGLFQDVFFIKGSPIYELDLMRAGVLRALKVVILADQGQPVDLGGIGLQDSLRYKKRPPAAYTSDVDNLVVAASVQRLYGSSAAGIMMVEMQHAEAFNFLQPQYQISLHHFVKKDFKRNKGALVHFGPPYMEGRAVSSTMLGFLMRSTFYNRNAMSIVEQLVQGGFVATEEGLSFDRLRVLDQIPVPQVYANKVYSFLFLSLLQDKGILALGLYRIKGNLGAPTSYVLTNPPKDCIVNPDDLIYILA